MNKIKWTLISIIGIFAINQVVLAEPLGNIDYNTISEMTGGQTFIMSKSEASGLTEEFLDIFVSNYYTGLMLVSDDLSVGGVKDYTFEVDSTMDKLSISISLLQNAYITLSRPDGSIVNSGDLNVNVRVLSQAVFYKIDKPAIGQWKININGQGAYTLNVAGSSPLSFDRLRFVEYGGRPGHMGYYETKGYPIAGIKQTVEATISDITSDVHFELRAKNGTLLSNLNLDMVDSYSDVETVFMSKDVDLPLESFMVYAIGKDGNGKEFQRVLANKIAPQTVAVQGPEGQDISLNTDTSYTFKVTNHGAADDFYFSAIDDQGFIVSTIPAISTIKNGETISVDVNVNPQDSTVGTMSTLTFSATPVSNSDALGNYAIVNSRVVD